MQQSPALPERHSVEMTTVAWLSVLVLIESLHFVFARLLLPFIGPGISAFYVQGVGTLIFGLYGLATRQLDWRILGRHWGFFLAIGALIGISTDMSYTAIAFVDPGTAAMLGKISTVFSLGFGVFWLRERFAPIQWVGALIAILGTFVIAFQPGSDYLRFGSLLILGSTIMYALHTALVKRFGGQIDFVNFFFFRLFSTTAVLGIVAAGQGVLTWPLATAWPIVIITALVDVVISRVLFYAALRRLHMSMHTIILTLSPVATIVWSLYLFGTWPGLQQLLGGSAVLLGVILVTWPRR
jgi:drug/metabolite transporter (DMT)-like permease